MAMKMSFLTKMKSGHWDDFDFDKLDRELGVVRSMGGMGRKRIEPSPSSPSSPCTPPFKTPLKRQCSVKLNSEKSLLEAMPQDLMVKILCGVEHEDLRQLLFVSKSVKDAALIAKNWHFAYHTPSSKTASLKSFNDEEDEQFDSCNPVLNAPKLKKGYWSRTNGRNLADISVALFRSPEK